MGTFTRAGVTKISLLFQQASRANRWWRSGEARATNEPKVQYGWRPCIRTGRGCGRYTGPLTTHLHTRVLRNRSPLRFPALSTQTRLPFSCGISRCSCAPLQQAPDSLSVSRRVRRNLPPFKGGVPSGRQGVLEHLTSAPRRGARAIASRISAARPTARRGPRVTRDVARELASAEHE